MRALVLALALTACTPTVPIDLTLVLPKNDAAFTQQIASYTLNAYSADDTRILATATLEVAKMNALQPRLSLKIGDDVRLRVRALDAQRQIIGAGESRFVVPTQQRTTLTAFVGPTSAFVAHPSDTSIARTDASTVQDGAGRMWIIGGRVDGAPTGAIEVYDPATLTFTKIEAELTPRVASPSVGRVIPAEGHELIVIAGGVLGDGSASGAVQVLDPQARTLNTQYRLPSNAARAHAAVFAPGDERFALFGGEGPKGDEATTGLRLIVDRFSSVLTDVNGPTGTAITLDTPVTDGQLFKLGERWFIAGRQPTVVLELDPSTGRAALAASSDLPRATPACVAATAANLYFACGSDRLERFTVDKDEIEIISRDAGARTGGELTALPDGRMLLTGGKFGEVATSTNVVFTTSPDGTPALAFHTPRVGHRLVFTTTHTLLALGGGPTEILAFDGP